MFFRYFKLSTSAPNLLLYSRTPSCYSITSYLKEAHSENVEHPLVLPLFCLFYKVLLYHVLCVTYHSNYSHLDLCKVDYSDSLLTASLPPVPTQ